MVDKNKIFEDLNASIGDSIQKKEHLLFKELLKFEKSYKKDLYPLVNNFIEFVAAEPNFENEFKPALKLAADSSKFTDGMVSKKSEFLLSRDGKYALKYLQKSKEEIQITLLTDSSMDTNEMLLYLPDIRKYYISNTYGDFLVTGYSSLRIGLMNFNAVLCFEKIIVTMEEKLFSIISCNNFSSPEIIESDDTFIKLKINGIKEYSTAVLSNESNKDFINSVNGILEIPIMLLRKKSTILLY